MLFFMKQENLYKTYFSSVVLAAKTALLMICCDSYFKVSETIPELG